MKTNEDNFVQGNKICRLSFNLKFNLEFKDTLFENIF